MRKILTILSIVSLTYISAAILTTDKPSYATTDTVKVNFSEMDNHHKDWIGIYPKGSSTAWKNVIKWAWTENKSEGTLTFKNLPAGEYEVRGFYNNSYKAEATKAFKVEGNEVPVDQHEAENDAVVQVVAPYIAPPDENLFDIDYSLSDNGDELVIEYEGCKEVFDISKDNEVELVGTPCH